MSHQIPLHASARAAEHETDGVHELAPDLAYQRLAIVNVVYWGLPHAGDGSWVLIDAGVMGTTAMLRSAVKARFGDTRPAAIVMTHGHFDHVGALEELAEEWNVPVYAHDLEHPYLNGSASYPPPDPSVGGGMMAALSPLYPRGPVNVGERLLSLPEDGSLPLMPGWQWLHTPGHTPGHVSFWHPERRLLIAGDAFITTRQESAYAALTQEPEMHGPPMYYTQNWEQAEESVRALAALSPEVAVTGHGRAMQGEALRAALTALARDFRQVAVPEHGRYAEQPTRAEDGSAYRKAS
ncbi:MAG: MBL fold metallo-hydrolase [Armatimonadota bacterium]